MIIIILICKIKERFLLFIFLLLFIPVFYDCHLVYFHQFSGHMFAARLKDAFTAEF